MGILDKLRRKQPPDAGARRRDLLKIGRITDGVILDCEENVAGEEVAVFL